MVYEKYVIGYLVWLEIKIMRIQLVLKEFRSLWYKLLNYYFKEVFIEGKVNEDYIIYCYRSE